MGSAQGVEHYQGKAAPLLDVVHVSFRGGNHICQVPSDEHSASSITWRDLQISKDGNVAALSSVSLESVRAVDIVP